MKAWESKMSLDSVANYGQRRVHRQDSDDAAS